MLLGSLPYLFTIDNDKVGNHAYVFENWKLMPILVTFENVTTCATTTNLTQVLVCVLLTSNNMDAQVVGQKLVSFGMNGGFVLIGVCNRITTQIKLDVTPFFVHVHCAH